MRVLHLISSSGFYGAEAVVANLAMGLRRNGCDAAIGSLQNGRRPDREFETRLHSYGLPVRDIPCQARFDRQTVRWIDEYVREQNFDLIHTHGYKADVHGYAAARMAGKPLLATCHNWTGENLRGRLYDWIDHLVLRRFARIAAVSDPVRNSLVRFGVRPERIRVIPNGVDVRRFEATWPRPPVYAGAAAQVGFVGRLVPEKGVNILLRSAPGVLSRHPHTVFLIIGEGPARAELEKLTDDLGIGSSVRFLGRQADMAAIYSLIDILVLPSLNEGAPMTVLEAMSAGRPVVATRTGALPDIVVEGETGILVGSGDAPAVESALVSLLADPARLLQMGRAGRSRVEAKFSSDSMARDYLDLYHSAAPVECLC